MGLSGAGKSAFISKYIQHEGPVTGVNLCSSTWTVSMYNYVVDKRIIHLIDTPGFDDHRRSDAQTLEEISFWLAQAAKRGIRAAGMIYMHRITNNRITRSSQRCLNLFKKICGSQNFHLCLLVTTHWDLVLHDRQLLEQALNRQRELLTKSELWGEVAELGGSYRALMNEQSATNILDDLFRQNNSVILLLQKQLLTLGGRLADTDAGKLVVDHYQELFLGLQQELDAIKDESMEAHRQQHHQRLQELRDLQRKIETTVETHNRELADMQVVYQFTHEATIQRIATQWQHMLKSVDRITQQDQDNFNEVQMLCDQVMTQLRQQSISQLGSRPPSQSATCNKSRRGASARSVSRSPPPSYSSSMNDGRLISHSSSRSSATSQIIRVSEEEQQHERSRSSRAEIIGASAGVASMTMAAVSLGCNIM